jgi:hypothetical protein
VSERRREQRIKRRLSARFECRGHTHLSFTGDISEKGLYLASPHVYPPGSPIQIELDAPNCKCRLEGLIAWSKHVPRHLFTVFKGGMGVRLKTTEVAEFRRLMAPEPPHRFVMKERPLGTKKRSPF